MGRYWVRGRVRVRVRARVRVRFKVVLRNVVVVKRENQRWKECLSCCVEPIKQSNQTVGYRIYLNMSVIFNCLGFTKTLFRALSIVLIFNLF